MIAIEVVREIILPDSRTESLTGIILAETSAEALALWEKQKENDLPYCLLMEKPRHYIPDSELEFREWVDKYGTKMWSDDYALNRLYHTIYP